VRGLAQRLRTGGFDAVWVHGWAHIGLRQTVTAACRCGLPVLLRGDSTPEPWRPVRLKRRLRDLFCRRWFRRIAGFLCVGTRNREFYRQFGIEPQRLFWMPYTVDNAFFQGRCRQARRSREALRQSLILAAGRPVVLFAGRLVADKAPDELLTAFSTLLSAPGRLPSPYLLVVGDGPLRHGLEQQARRYGDAVRFLGFRNQTELPAFYDLCDLFVLPSRFEPWGLVVNEVMNAGKPVIVSDRVGAAPDLVEDGANGFVYPSGEVPTLTAQIAEVLECERRREEMGQRSLERIKAWGFDADRRGLIEAVEFVCCRAKE
jgi:glycosyltransferase involved in cell wall biosynthesis